MFLAFSLFYHYISRSCGGCVSWSLRRILTSGASVLSSPSLSSSSLSSASAQAAPSWGRSCWSWYRTENIPNSRVGGQRQEQRHRVPYGNIRWGQDCGHIQSHLNCLRLPVGKILINKMDEEAQKFGVEDSGEYEDFPQVKSHMLSRNIHRTPS